MDDGVVQAESPPGRTPWSRVARRIRVPLTFAVGIASIWLARPTVISILAGALAMIPGLLLRAFASGYVEKDRELTTGGPYAYTRNPLYLGSLIIGAGFAVAARSWWIVALMLFVFAVIYVPVIAGEERFLRQTFPGYADYARHVPRLLPRLTPYGSAKGEYSSVRYKQHREYQAAIGCLVMLAILLAKLIIVPTA